MVGAELLAPRAVLLTKTNRVAATENQAGWVEILRTRFGLPESYAEWYTRRILGETHNNKSFSEVLGF